MTKSRFRQFLRCLKFSLVGAVGLGVQLAALAALTALRVNYLLATGLAVESALVHNFFWHQRFTWSDRALPAHRETRRSQAIERLLRFQLSNGGISLTGNLLLMRVLVDSARIPVLLANLVSVAICSWVNFVASDQWVFSSSRDSAELG
jgi:putative flippase GtrA